MSPALVKPILTKEERRARRDARREKERAANIGRAAKMHVARLAWEASPSTVLPTRPEALAQRFYVGCSGWFYWDWRGKFYPEGLSTAKWFDYYRARFRTVELNAPFYSWPTINTVQTWVKQAGRSDFVYTVKAPELITHIKRFRGVKTLIRDFGHIADLLRRRMGCFLFQLPPSYDYTFNRLKSILSQLDPARRNVVEFRHPSWWNNEVFSAFRSNGTIFCSCSGPRLPNELVRTTDEIYVRFHGVKKWYRHDYTRDELSEWSKKIRESGATRVFAYFNNDYQGYALKNARSLFRMLRK